MLCSIANDFLAIAEEWETRRYVLGDVLNPKQINAGLREELLLTELVCIPPIIQGLVFLLDNSEIYPIEYLLTWQILHRRPLTLPAPQSQAQAQSARL